MLTKLLNSVAVVGICMFAGACSGDLQVYDGTQKKVAGLPFRAGELYVKFAKHDKLKSGGDCELADFSEPLALPTGAQYFVTATSADFAKTGFTVKYAGTGTLSEVTLNSEPAGAEEIKAVTEAVKTAATIAGLTAAHTVPPNSKLPPCDAGEVGVKFVKFDSLVHP